MDKKRSVGVWVCGITMLIYSLWLFIAVPITPVSYFFYRILPTPFKMALRLSAGLPLLTLLVSLIYLVSSIGILRLRNWARLLAVFFSVLLLLPIALAIFAIIGGIIEGGLEGPGAIGIGMAWIIIRPLLISLPFLIFFTRPKVKEQFK